MFLGTVYLLLQKAADMLDIKQRFYSFMIEVQFRTYEYNNIFRKCSLSWR